MKTKANLSFAAMPKDYEALCRLFLPRPIHDKTDYANTVEMAEVFAGFEKMMTVDQTDYFDHLCTLIERYDAERMKWRKVSGVGLLQHLLDDHGLSGADLSRILGASSRHLGPMILRGEREITAEHARVLGKHFALNPGVFIE